MLKGHNCGHVINSNKFRAEAHSAHTAHPVFAKRGCMLQIPTNYQTKSF